MRLGQVGRGAFLVTGITSHVVNGRFQLIP